MALAQVIAYICIFPRNAMGFLLLSLAKGAIMRERVI